MAVKMLLFDIGGVLAEYVGLKRMIFLMKDKMTPEELAEHWMKSAVVTAYESGKNTSEEFAVSIIKELNMDVSPEDYIKEFPLYVTGLFPGATELLCALKPKYTLACLSNTNTMQWNGLCDREAIDELFHHTFLSFEIGTIKPDPAIFTYVLDYARENFDCLPVEITFFDDVDENVQTGIAAGMRAYKVRDFRDLKNKIGELDLM